MGKWFFQEHDGFQDINQSSSAEAFEGPAYRDLTPSLVRESVQNILDVTSEEENPDRVRFTLIENPEANFQKPWFDQLMHHLQQPGAGLPDAPSDDDTCRFLLIEDFNTTELVGDYPGKSLFASLTTSSIVRLGPTTVRTTSTSAKPGVIIRSWGISPISGGHFDLIAKYRGG